MSPSNIFNNATFKTFLEAVTYKSVASVIKQCYKTRENSLISNNAIPRKVHRNSKFRSNPMTKEVYENKAMKYPCGMCGKYGHWKIEHHFDGSLPPGIRSVDKPAKDKVKAHVSEQRSKPKTVSFNMATVSG